jgi:general secretion pathway protein D
MKNTLLNTAAHTPRKMMMHGKVATCALLSLLIGCSPLHTVRTYDMGIPGKLVDNSETRPTSENSAAQQETDKAPLPRFSNVPTQPASSVKTSALQADSTIALKGEATTINVENLPLPEFINQVFGDTLGLSYHLDPKLKDLKDLVTLRIDTPLHPQDLYKAAQNILQTYGVSIQSDEDLIQFMYAPSGSYTEPPIIISGSALPSVPSTHRPVFYLMHLKVVEAQQAVSWLSQAFEGQKATFRSDPTRNAVWLQGTLDTVKQAAEVVKLVDQPLMRGRNSLRIEPRFLGADKLAARLVDMFKAQGYNATLGQNGTINFFVIEETNSIITFSADATLLGYVKNWVEELDKPLKQTKGNNAFYYEVQRTSATGIVETLNQLRGAGGLSAQPTNQNDEGSDTKATNKSTTGASNRSSLVVDPSRNALLFYGSNDEWMGMLPTIEKLDREPLQVLIEVIVAEVTLSDGFEYGIDWAANNIGSTLFEGAKAKSASFIDGNLQYFPINSSGSTRAVLNLLGNDKKVKILQTPRILVRSGEQATINVGNEIPLQSSSTTSPEGGAITTTTQYRRTGNSLTVSPVVFAGGQVALELNQELSNNAGGGVDGQPVIFSRSISTALTIEDGGSVLVGGLIDSTDGNATNKVPILGDLPILGKLFFSKVTRDTSRTELMILINPYVIRSSRDAKAVTDAFKSRLTLQPEKSNEATTSDQ